MLITTCILIMLLTTNGLLMLAQQQLRIIHLQILVKIMLQTAKKRMKYSKIAWARNTKLILLNILLLAVHLSRIAHL